MSRRIGHQDGEAEAAAVTMAVFAAIGGLAGIVLAITLIGAPAGVAPTSACGPSTLVQDAGFDPWTGQPRGQVIRGRCFHREYVTESQPPDELVGRTGFPWASALTATLAFVGLVAGWVLSRIQRTSA